MTARKAKDPPESPESAPEASSAGSSTSSPYVGSTGPGFDAGAAPAAAPDEVDPAELEAYALGWEQDQVESWLLNAGDMAHAGLGVAERDWQMTKADLERIAPPLTRILNRFEPSRAVAAYSDPAAVAMGFGMYGWRSALERSAVTKAEARQEDGASVTPHAPAPAAAPGPQPVSDLDLDADGLTWADRLRATRPPEAP